MFKKQRYKFFGLVSLFTSIVFSVFYLCLNVFFIESTTKNIKSELVLLNENYNNDNFDLKMGKSFFVVYINEDESINFFQHDVNKISKDTAISYALKNVNDPSIYGREKDFYYIREDYSDNSIRFIFLDCEIQYDLMAKVSFVSGIVSITLWLLVNLVSFSFSRMAIKPYIEQYENEKIFITNASHEIKTPLAIIQANVEVLSLENENNKWIESTLKQTNRMTKLVNNLVLLTKLNENLGESLKFESFNISELLYDAVETYKIIAEKNNFTYSYEIEDNIFYEGDIESISKLFSILLDNAMKYTKDNGNITIKLASDKKGIIIIFKNTCDELKKENVSKYFDRFYREDQSRSRKTGYGIGLSLAKSIVEVHRGIIKAEIDNDNIEFIIRLK